MLRPFRNTLRIRFLEVEAVLTTPTDVVRGGRRPTVSSHSLGTAGKLVAKAPSRKAGMR